MSSKSWLLSALPPAISPYVELTRVAYRPPAVLIPYLPILIAILQVGAVAQLPPGLVLNTSLKWLLLTWVYGAYGCVVDDVADQDLDRQVERCQNRPVVRGAVTTTGGCIFAGGLAAVSVALTHAFFPAQPALHIPVAIIGSTIYPFLKRFTHYAMVYLGALYAAVGFNASRTMGIDVLAASGPALHSLLLLSGATGVYLLSVETVYMHADLEDDVKAGIKSLAVRIQGFAKPVLLVLALVYAALLLASGVVADFGPYYFTGAACSALTLFTVIARVDLKNSEMCEIYFFMGQMIIGGSLAAGLCAEYGYA